MAASFEGKWRGGIHGNTFTVYVSGGGQIYANWLGAGGEGGGEFAGLIRQGVARGTWFDVSIQGNKRSDSQVRCCMRGNGQEWWRLVVVGGRG